MMKRTILSLNIRPINTQSVSAGNLSPVILKLLKKERCVTARIECCADLATSRIRFRIPSIASKLRTSLKAYEECSEDGNSYFAIDKHELSICDDDYLVLVLDLPMQNVAGLESIFRDLTQVCHLPISGLPYTDEQLFSQYGEVEYWDRYCELHQTAPEEP